MFQGTLNEVLFWYFVEAWTSSQLPEQKEGLFFLEYDVSSPALPLNKVLMFYLNDPWTFYWVMMKDGGWCVNAMVLMLMHPCHWFLFSDIFAIIAVLVRRLSDYMEGILKDCAGQKQPWNNEIIMRAFFSISLAVMSSLQSDLVNSRGFQGFQGWSMCVTRLFQRYFKWILKRFGGCFKGV